MAPAGVAPLSSSQCFDRHPQNGVDRAQEEEEDEEKEELPVTGGPSKELPVTGGPFKGPYKVLIRTL